MSTISSLVKPSSLTSRLIGLINELRCRELKDLGTHRCTWVVANASAKYTDKYAILQSETVSGGSEKNASPSYQFAPILGIQFRSTSAQQGQELVTLLEKENLRPQAHLPGDQAVVAKKSFKNSAATDTYIIPGSDDGDAQIQDSKDLLSYLLKSCATTSPDGSVQLTANLLSENIIVEYGSPNIAKPLHMGHLRSTVTGHYVSKICKAAGHQVTTICFLGDWGTQFGVLHAGLAQWLPREEDEPMMKAVYKLSLHELLGYYVRAAQEEKANEEFASKTRKMALALEKQERLAIDIWATVREKTVNHLGTMWHLFGIKYDVIQGESEFAVESDHTEEAMQALKQKADLETGSDGCVFAKILTRGKDPTEIKVPLVKADGGSLYLLRDIAAARSRFQKFKFDRMIYVVDKSQANHFINLFTLITQIGFTKTSDTEPTIMAPNFLQHVSFGKVEGMSTRSGNFVLLSDVINDGTILMHEARSQSSNTRRQTEDYQDRIISTKLAISALIVNALKIRRNRDCKFEWVEALKPNGDTGVKLQYTHARLISLEKKQNLGGEVADTEFDMDYLFDDPLALDLALYLINFEDSFWASYHELEPCILLTYLFKLADKVSKCLKELQVQSQLDPNIAKTRLKLFILSRRILAFGLNTIGIEPLNEI